MTAHIVYMEIDHDGHHKRRERYIALHEEVETGDHWVTVTDSGTVIAEYSRSNVVKVIH